MNVTKKQTEEILSKYLNKENGLNDVLQMTLNAMMYSEREEYLSGRTNNKGNGFRLGKVFGHGSQIELRIPRDRQSDFTPTILALFRDQEEYLKEVSFMMYSKGLTTRDVSEVMETIYGGSYSKSKVSDISKSFYERMDIWRSRRLDKHYMALYIDGLHVKLRRDGSYRNECFYIILGLKEDYTREVISIVNFPTESATGWDNIFKDLQERGLDSIGIIVSDGLKGLEGSIASNYPNTPHQKCIVHLQRNLQAYVPTEKRKELAEDIRQVLSPDDPLNNKEIAYKNLQNIAEKWKKTSKSLSDKLKKMEWQPYFTYLDYHVKVRRMLYTTNWIERFNKSARRTLKIRGAFPNEDSVMALITSAAIEKSDKKYKYPVYNFKFEPKLMQTH